MRNAFSIACGIIVATAFSLATTVNVYAAEGSSGTSDSDNPLGKAFTSLIGEDDVTVTEPTKNETVYVTTDATGAPSQVKVVSELVNAKKARDIVDVSGLIDIEAVDEDTAYVKNSDGTITWMADGDDVNYQGVLPTSTALPIDMRVTYYLDGTEIAPSTLAGKTGHVKIRYDFTNNSTQAVTVDGTRTTVNTPFVMLTALTLSDDDFKNVKVSNGRIISDSGRTIVIGFAAPGMQESLGVSRDTLDLPSSIEIEADVVEFSLGTAMTMGVVLGGDDVDTGDFDDLSGAGDALMAAMGALIDGTSALYDGMAQLAEGSGALDEGVQALAQGSVGLSTGIGQLKQATDELPGATSALADGTSALASGLAGAVTGAKQLADAAHAVDDGAQQVRGGIEQLDAGTLQVIDAIGSGSDDENPTILKGVDGAKLYLDGATQALAGEDGASSALSAASVLLGESDSTDDSTAVGAMNAALGALAKGGEVDLETFDDAATTATTAETALIGSAGTLSSSGSQLAAAATNISGAEETASSTSADISRAADALSGISTDGMTDEQKAAIADAQTALQTAQASAGSTASKLSDASAAASNAAGSANAAAEAAQDAASAAGDTAKAAEGAKKALESADVATAQDELGKALTATATAKAYVDGAVSAVSQVVTSALQPATVALDASSAALRQVKGAPASDENAATGLYVLQAGAQQLVASMGDASSEETLLYGTNAVAAGLDGLSTGLGDAASGADQVAAGTQQLADAAPALEKGVSALDEGAGQLAKGAGQIAEVTPQLAEGLNAAADGTQQLADGLQQFSDEGISKIVDAFGGDTSRLVSRINPLMRAGRAYNNFSGIATGTEGSVRFIYRTESIGK